MSQVDFTSKPDKGSDASPSIEDRIQHLERKVASLRQHEKAQEPGDEAQGDDESWLTLCIFAVAMCPWACACYFIGIALGGVL